MEIKERLLTSDNYGKGRHGQKIEAIVLHIMEGTIGGSEAWFNEPQSDVSSHYGIGMTGEIRRWVKDEDTAWHAGTVVSATSRMVNNRPGINPNYYTIGIEHEGNAETIGTQAMLNASADLVAMLCKKYNISPDRDHIILHREIRANKTCPGKLNVDYIMLRVAAAFTQPSAVVNKAAKIEEELVRIEGCLNNIRETIK